MAECPKKIRCTCDKKNQQCYDKIMYTNLFLLNILVQKFIELIRKIAKSDA